MATIYKNAAGQDVYKNDQNVEVDAKTGQPLAPAAPVAPVAPEAPVVPPVAPAAPVAPVAPAAPPVAPVAPVVPTAKSYTVNAGDTLSQIAAKFGVPVTAISGYRSGDPNKIFPGETLQIGATVAPAPAAPAAPAAPTVPEKPTEPVIPDATSINPQDELSKFFSSVYGQSPDALAYGFNTNPAKTIKDLVSEVMTSTGLPEAKSRLETITKEIEKVSNERDDLIQEINDNPFISAGTKRERIEKITDKYEKRITNRTNQLKLMEGAYDDARQEAQFAATTAINLYDRNRNFDQSRLEFVMTQAEKLLGAKKDQLTEVSPGATLYDPVTGKAVYTAPTAKSQDSDGQNVFEYTKTDYTEDELVLRNARGEDGYTDPSLYLQLYNAWVSAGGSEKEFISQFPPSKWVNPGNSWLPPQLRNKSAQTLEQQIDSLF